MEEHLAPLGPFRKLVRDSFKFYFSHFRDFLFFFLPIEICVLVVSLILVLYKSEMPFLLWVVIFSISVLLQAFRIVMVFAGGRMSEDIGASGLHDPFVWYKELFWKTGSVIRVMILELSLLVAYLTLTMLGGVVLLLLPFILLSIFSKFNPAVINLISLDGGSITLGLFTIILIAAVVLNFRFLLNIWFSSYALLLEGRKGVDALASSFLYVRGHKGQIFWRFVLIIFISLVPVLVLLGPVYIFILISAVKSAALTIALFGTLPAIPEAPLHLSLWRIGLSFLSSLVTLPIFIALNFHLWKDVKASVSHFDEASYTAVRKNIRKGIYAGSVIIALCLALALISLSSAGSETSTIPDFGSLPASGMM